MELSLQCSPETGGEKIVNWTQNHWKGRNLKAIMCKFGLGATVYPSGSTEVLFISSEEQILAANMKQVKASVEFKGSFWLLMRTQRDLQQMGLMR